MNSASPTSNCECLSKPKKRFTHRDSFRPREYIPDDGPWDPVTGAASAIVGTAGQMMMGVADFPIETLKLLNIHPDSRKGKGKAKQTEAEPSSAGGRDPASRTNADPRPDTANSTASPSQVYGSGAPEGGAGASSQILAGSTPSTPRADTDRSGFMAQAMAQSSQVSHSRSSSRDRGLLRPMCGPTRGSNGGRSGSVSGSDVRDKSGTVWSDRSGFSERLHNMNQDSIVGTGKGVGRIVGAGFKSPLDFSMNVAQGFHNVPKLYGGDVRQVDKVTDLQSGLKTAAKVSCVFVT